MVEGCLPVVFYVICHLFDKRQCTAQSAVFSRCLAAAIAAYWPMVYERTDTENKVKET